MIDIERIFNEISGDKNLVEKLVITVILTLSVALFPVGFISLAALWGYQLEMTRNVRDRLPAPLPRWTQFGEKINKGVGLLIASVLYNLPNMLWGCIFSTSVFGGGDRGIALAVSCCMLPLIVAYNVFTVPLFAVGLVRFAETGRVESFLRFGELFDIVRNNVTLVIQWWIYTTLANVILGLMFAIPCIGWIAASALSTPVHGHITGQFAGLLDRSKLKRN